MRTGPYAGPQHDRYSRPSSSGSESSGIGVGGTARTFHQSTRGTQEGYDADRESVASSGKNEGGQKDKRKIPLPPARKGTGSSIVLSGSVDVASSSADTKSDKKDTKPPPSAQDKGKDKDKGRESKSGG